MLRKPLCVHVVIYSRRNTSSTVLGTVRIRSFESLVRSLLRWIGNIYVLRLIFRDVMRLRVNILARYNRYALSAVLCATFT